MERALKAVAPGAVITGTVGRSSSFEVVVNGKTVWSKLSAGGFPNYGELANKIKEGTA